MNLILFQHPWLIFCGLICAGMCTFAVRTERKWLIGGSCAAVSFLLLAGLGCLLPYEEILLLLLPSLAAAFLAGRKEGTE